MSTNDCNRAYLYHKIVHGHTTQLHHPKPSTTDTLSQIKATKTRTKYSRQSVASWRSPAPTSSEHQEQLESVEESQQCSSEVASRNLLDSVALTVEDLR